MSSILIRQDRPCLLHTTEQLLNYPATAILTDNQDLFIADGRGRFLQFEANNQQLYAATEAFMAELDINLQRVHDSATLKVYPQHHRRVCTVLELAGTMPLRSIYGDEIDDEGQAEPLF